MIRAIATETLTAVDGIPAHIAGQFEEPITFQRVADGDYLVFDRRAHSVYRIDERRTAARKIVDIGPESGRLLGPTAFDSQSDGRFVVADAPNMVERIQVFGADGVKTGGFRLPGRASARVTLGSLALSGVTSLQFTGRSILINQPETGALITEYGLSGTPLRTFGTLRPTRQEHDRDVHLALNVGLPLVHPAGGYYFVFLTGEPRFRRYGSDGTLLLDRLAQGSEADALLGSMPTVWPRRSIGGETLPLVPPVLLAAAVDGAGRLWLSLVSSVTYVFDADGDRVRVVKLRAAGDVSPSSLFFSGSRLLVAPGLHEFDTR